MGDPNGDDPRYIASNATKDGRFVLDLKAFEPVLKQRVKGVYRP